eukprot:285835_1
MSSWTILHVTLSFILQLISIANANKYFRSDSKLDTYDDAIAYCKSKSGDLASFHSHSDLEELHDICKSCENHWTHCFIGLEDRDNNGEYTFIDGTEVDYQNWAPDEPLDSPFYTNYRCGTLLSRDCTSFDKTVSARDCSANFYALCQDSIATDESNINVLFDLIVVLVIVCCSFVLFMCCMIFSFIFLSKHKKISYVKIINSLSGYLEIMDMVILLFEDCVAIYFEDTQQTINATVVVLVFSLLGIIVHFCEVINRKLFYIARTLIIIFEIIQAGLFIWLTDFNYLLAIIFILILITQLFLLILQSVDEYYSVLLVTESKTSEKQTETQLHSMDTAAERSTWHFSLISTVFTAPLAFWVCNDCVGLQIAIAVQIWIYLVQGRLLVAIRLKGILGTGLKLKESIIYLLISLLVITFGTPLNLFYISQQWMPDTGSLWSRESDQGYVTFIVVYVGLWYTLWGVAFPIWWTYLLCI